MGRNRTRTTCACGFWDFAWPGRPTAEVEAEFPGLLPWNELRAEFGRPGRGPQGYGFGDHMFGRVSLGWVSPDGRTSSNRHGGPGWVERWFEYVPVAHEDRYRYARVECPACKRSYVGWYRAVPGSTGAVERRRTYELYDTSFWHSGSDDPSDADLEGVIGWTPELVVEALGSFHGANPHRFGRSA